MSNENTAGGNQSDESSVNDSVSKKAYEDVAKDLHKFKNAFKTEKQRAAEYEVKLQALEEEKMRENEQWKELADKYKHEAEKARQELTTSKDNFINTVKKQALKDELGIVNDKYLIHADLNNIEVNEYGIVDKDSLLNVANSFREEHGILLQKPSSANPTSAAAQSIKKQPQTLEDLSLEDKLELLRSMKKQS